MPLVDLLKVARDRFQSNLQVVNSTLGDQPIYIQPARESLRAVFSTALTTIFASDLQPIVGSAGSVGERLARLAVAHGRQQPAIHTVFPDPVDRDEVLKVTLAALQAAFTKVLS